MTKNRVPDPPGHLSDAAKGLWKRLHSDFDLSDANGVAVLTTALEAFDTMAAARARFQAEGLTVIDRFKQEKAHPCVAIERDARAQFLQAMKLLQLPITDDAPKGPGRPFGS